MFVGLMVGCTEMVLLEVMGCAEAGGGAVTVLDEVGCVLVNDAAGDALGLDVCADAGPSLADLSNVISDQGPHVSRADRLRGNERLYICRADRLRGLGRPIRWAGRKLRSRLSRIRRRDLGRARGCGLGRSIVHSGG